jgi:predicted permease
MSVLASLAPVFAMIVAGYGLRRRAIVDERFWPAAEHLTFYLFFPALLLTNTARAEFGGTALGAMAAATALGIGIVSLATIPVRRALRLNGPAFSSVVQAAIRPNVYVAIATAAAVAGPPGLAAVSLCVAIAVPLVNLISIAALVRHAAPASAAVGVGPVALSVLRNPLIAACLLGLAMNALGLPLPAVLGPFLELLSRAALPLGLLAVGAGLDLAAVRYAGPAVLAAAALKLAVLPLVTLALLHALAVDGTARTVAVLFAGLPVSASAYVMARQMGGDAPLLAATITLTTLAAALTLPLWLALVV